MPVLDLTADSGIIGPEVRMSTQTSGQRLLDVHAVAARLGVIDRWVRYLLKTKRLKGERFGRQWVIRESDVAVFERREEQRKEANERAHTEAGRHTERVIQKVIKATKKKRRPARA